jgi:hypothetical protein
MGPDYKQIYTDIIKEKYPEKSNDLQIKNRIERIQTVMDILSLNTLVFGQAKAITESNNQKLRSYDEDSVLKILEYQQKNKLSNNKTALHFKMSRNTIAKWKKYYNLFINKV